MKSLLGIPVESLKELGIIDWGYTEEPVPQSFDKFEKWVGNNHSAPLNYLSDHRKDLRQNLKTIYPDFQSALVFLFSYQESKKWLLENEQHEVAGYTLGFNGEDYHSALKYRLDSIFATLKMSHSDLERFISLDAQPVLERDLAYRSGLGWFGKNSMLINKKEGSYFIIGSLLLNRKLELLSPQLDIDHCGTCTACIDACPTQAIDTVNRTLIASKCISTFTIEIFKDAEAPEGFDNSRGEIFGCDICQDVCPWNKKPLERVVASLKIKESLSFIKKWLFEMPKSEFAKMLSLESNRSFKKKLQGTAFDRPGKTGWLKNLKAHMARSNRNDS